LRVMSPMSLLTRYGHCCRKNRIYGLKDKVRGYVHGTHALHEYA
jgi:hypothetical protein